MIDMLNMLLLLMLPYLVVFFLTFCVASAVVRLWNGTGKGKRRRHPPSFPSLPLVGSLPFLTDIADLPELFRKKSKELGPIFTVKVGSRLTLVLNTRDVVDEALSKQSLSYAGREIFYTEKHIFNRNLKGIVGRNFDAEYKRYHSIYMSILKKLGFGVQNVTQSRIMVELEALVHELKKLNGMAFDPKALTLLVVSNVVGSILFGRRQEFAKGLTDVARLGVTVIEHADVTLDLAPILRFVPNRWRNLQMLKKLNEEFVGFIMKEIRKSATDGAPDSFVKCILEKRELEYDKENLTVTLRELVIAGSDTLLSTMLWSFVLLANNPDVQDRMQKEIDEVVPRDRFPALEDKMKLPYIEATMLEIMRIRTVVPLSVPRLTLSDTEVGGYFIPAGIVVLPNLHAVHMEPSVFVEPDKFRPDRFLDERNNVARDLVIPFSVGRRSCLGETLARQEFFLTLSCLVQRFTIRPPEGVQTIDVGVSGSIVRKPGSFEVRIIPRED